MGEKNLGMTWPEPKPCKPKWGRVPFDQMLRHIREDKYEQCRNMVAYLNREAALELYLRTPSLFGAQLVHRPGIQSRLHLFFIIAAGTAGSKFNRGTFNGR
jgi:hypothetical protein